MRRPECHRGAAARMAAFLVACSAAMAACSSAPPIRYYTLMDNVPPVALSASGPTWLFELLPVGIPAQADQQPIVVRQATADTVLLLENERWIAPLGDELRAALSAELSRYPGATDVSGLPHDAAATVLRIKVDVRRFESVPSQQALLDVAWTLRRVGTKEEAAVVLCGSRIVEAVAPGVPGVVQGHQRALARLARQIAEVATSWTQNRAPICPAPVLLPGPVAG